MKLKNLNETLKHEFQDPDFAALYLKEALQENGMEGFLLALRNIIQANEGISKVAQETELGRESLYKTLSENGNPQFSTVCKIISSLGLQISFEPSSM